MRDSDTIEKMAVNAVDDAITKCPLLSPHFTSGDKYPSVDGNIIIYEKNGNNKEDILTTIWVQIKGKECDSLIAEEITYAIEVRDLYNYLKIGGCLFFVVQIDCNDNRKIFYETLLPVKIQELQDNIVDGQKTKNITLRTFPNDKYAIETIVHNFGIDARKQSSFALSKLLTLDELNNNSNIESITFSTTNISKEKDRFIPFFENEICFYAKFKGASTAEPIKNAHGNLLIEQTFNAPVLVGDKQYYQSFKISYTKNGLIFLFGSCFRMALNYDLGQGKITYNPPASLSKRYESLVFVNDLLEKKTLSINSRQYNIDKCNSIFSEQIKLDWDLCNSLKKLFKVLHIQEDLNMNQLTDKNIKDIKTLEKCIVNNEAVTNINLNNNTVMCTDLRLSNVVIRLLLTKSDDSEGFYNVEDFFNLRLTKLVYRKLDSCKENILPAIATLKIDDYCKLSNINYEGLINEFKSLYVDNPDIINIANNVLNSLIHAYDKSSNPRMLIAAQDIAYWLLGEEVLGVTEAGKKLDIIQIKKRQRNLQSSEIEEIHLIIDDNKTSVLDRIGAFLLLGDKTTARRLFKTLDKQQKKFFNESTLHKFWK